MRLTAEIGEPLDHLRQLDSYCRFELFRIDRIERSFLPSDCGKGVTDGRESVPTLDATKNG
jgi:hypothetical protein